MTGISRLCYWSTFPIDCSGNMLLRMYKLHEENVAEHLGAYTLNES
jgi:hypothetical protein